LNRCSQILDEHLVLQIKIQVCSCEVNLLSDVGGVENESPEMKAVRRQQSFKLAMAGVTNAKEAANFRWARMENMNACYHSRRLQIAIQYTFPFQYCQL
jgi:hypothetical protein